MGRDGVSAATTDSSAAVTCGRLLDQRSDLLPSCRHLSMLVTIERPSTARGRHGRALMSLDRVTVARSVFS